MGFELAGFGPVISLIVMVDVAEEKAFGGSMDDDAEVEVDARMEQKCFSLTFSSL